MEQAGKYVDGMRMHYLLTQIRLVQQGYANARGMVEDFGLTWADLMYSRMIDAAQVAHNRLETCDDIDDMVRTMQILTQQFECVDALAVLRVIERLVLNLQKELEK